MTTKRSQEVVAEISPVALIKVIGCGGGGSNALNRMIKANMKGIEFIAVNTDAHSIKELAFITAGINQARRAWLEAGDVLNTHPLKTLLKFLQR